ncbi:hypothetical protein MSG28_012656 [Choristoneura fumiferana]|nr:hypothetical protein MSG28_012656 [Choristoneura fumiferana]
MSCFPPQRKKGSGLVHLGNNGDENRSPLRWSPPSSAALVAAALAPPALRPWLPDPPSKKTNHLAVQNERQPRNTATIRPETLRDMDQERALREAAVAVGVFG